jgi:hypothetical protein
MDILALAERAKNFNANLKLYQAMAVQASEKLLVELNRKQMMSSTDSKGEALVHKSTGSPLLSFPYAKRTGKRKPNLKLNGDFEKEMFLETDENAGIYFIGSFDFKTPFLEENYGDIFGTAPSNFDEAEIEASKHLFNIYKEKVWNG